MTGQEEVDRREKSDKGKRQDCLRKSSDYDTPDLVFTEHILCTQPRGWMLRVWRVIQPSNWAIWAPCYFADKLYCRGRAPDISPA